MSEREHSTSDDIRSATLDFRVIFETAPNVQLVLAPDPPHFTMLAASDARLAATLTTRDATIGRPLFEVFADANPGNPEPDGVAKLRASLETVLRTRAPHRMPVQRYDLERPDGTWDVRYWAPHNVPVLAPDGAVRWIIHHVQDVTDLVREREATTEAVQREAELREVLESIADAFYLLDRDWRFIHVNDAAEPLLQTTREALLGRTLWEAFPDVTGSVFEGPYREAMDHGRSTSAEAYFAPLGTWFDVRAYPWPGGVMVHFRDVGARKAAEAERERLLAATEAARRELEIANRAKSDFLAVMSHELRTPLNAIGGYAQLLEIGLHGPVTDSQREALDRIQRSQRHLLGLIAGVLDFSRLESGAVAYQLADVPVVEAVAEAEALIAPQLRAKGLGYACSGAVPGLAVRADREKLQQILLNVLSNAVKFTHARNGTPGRIEVTCAVDAPGPGAMVRICVRDTGTGIAPEKLEHVFAPFVQADQGLTREHQGVGLGLAISRDLARGMGGDLSAESVPGVGTTLTLSLPAVNQLES